MFYSFLLACLISINSSHAPQTSCEELIRFTKSEGYRYGSVGSLSLMSSSWLNNVDAYKVDGILVVIASIKSEGSFFSQDYIFCGIPESNWSSFSTPFGSDSYGERFNDYIMAYRCNCN
jgi:hypothetical protein